MPYTVSLEKKHAKAWGSNLRVSTKSSVKLCRFVRGKKLAVAKRFLNDLIAKKRELDGKYYTKAAGEFLKLMNSCEKNADNIGLDRAGLFVHASAHMGQMFNRKRRKGKFGSRMKSTNMEIMLIER